MSTKRGFVASRNARRSDGSFSASKNKRFTKDGIPIQYVFIDESGRPYYEVEDPYPFVMGAVVTDNPDKLIEIIHSMESDELPNGSGELKSSRLREQPRKGFMNRMQNEGIGMFVTSHKMYNQTDNGEDASAVTYASALSRLFFGIAEHGPKGIYRIRIDESEYIDSDFSEMLAKNAFQDADGRELARHKPCMMVDSEFDPHVQVADLLAGTYRRTIKSGTSDKFAEDRGITVANTRPKSENRVAPRIIDGLRHSRQTARNRAKVYRGAANPIPPSNQTAGPPRRAGRHHHPRI